jgi:hypothetical protein
MASRRRVMHFQQEQAKHIAWIVVNQSLKLGGKLSKDASTASNANQNTTINQK